MDTLIYAAHFLEQFKPPERNGPTILYADSATVPVLDCFDLDHENIGRTGDRPARLAREHFSVPFLERDVYTVQKLKNGFSISIPTGQSDYLDDIPGIVDSGICAKRYRS